jgi:hypothetical protein
MTQSSTIHPELQEIAAKGVAALVQEITNYGEFKANNEVRVISEDAMTVGKTIRQGDIYLTRIGAAPKGLTPYPANESGYQLAPGSTKGSRHCVSKTNVEAFTQEKPGIIDGPIVVAKDRFSLTHPEHAWFDLPAGTYKVTYQLDFVRQQRSKD